MPDTQIRGSLAVSRSASVGGSATIRGSVQIAGNINVGGWLDAPNIKTPCKGLFADIDSLVSAFPRPLPGWWALVGSALPARIYRCGDHRWEDTGETGGDISVDLSVYDRRLDQLSEAIQDVSAGSASSEHPVETRETDAADLILADAQGNAIATFAGGHIRTAYFDSSSMGLTQTDYQPSTGTSSQPSPFDGLKLSILGDSISTYSGSMPAGYEAFYPRGDVNMRKVTWWGILAERLGMTLLCNCSWNGCCMRGNTDDSRGYVGCSDKRIADLADGDSLPDVIIIWIGVNDWAAGNPLGDFNDKSTPPDTVGALPNFSTSYARAIFKIRESYPLAKLYCCTLLDVYNFYNPPSMPYPRINGGGLTLHDFNKKIREIADFTGATVIDMHSCGANYWNHSEYFIDGLHPNAAGAALAAQKAINTLLYS